MRVTLLRIGVGLGGLGLALGFLGRTWWAFDLLSSYRPVLGAALFVLGLIALLFDREAGLAALLAGAVGLASLFPFYLGSRPVPAADAATIEVVSFNVTLANPNRIEIAQYLVEEDPDVVFLFESNSVWEADMREAGVSLAIINSVPRGRAAGVTVLAAADLQPVAIEADFWREAAAVAVTLEGRTIEVLGVHPPSPRDARRAETRDRVLSNAAQWVAGREAPVVLVGDLNASPWSAAYRALRWRTGMVDSMFGAGIQPSWPDGWGPLAVPIDHVLHSRQLGSIDRRTGPALGSTHRPVLVSVGWAARTP